MYTVSVEKVLKIVYQPQAIFRIRPVNRCSATIAGMFRIDFLLVQLGFIFTLPRVNAILVGLYLFCLLSYSLYSLRNFPNQK